MVFAENVKRVTAEKRVVAIRPLYWLMSFPVYEIERTNIDGQRSGSDLGTGVRK